jgi:hypothetical protein
VNGDTSMRPWRTGTRSGMRVAACSSRSATGSGRSDAGDQRPWLDRGASVRACFPRAIRSSSVSERPRGPRPAAVPGGSFLAAMPGDSRGAVGDVLRSTVDRSGVRARTVSSASREAPPAVVRLEPADRVATTELSLSLLARATSALAASAESRENWTRSPTTRSKFSRRKRPCVMAQLGQSERGSFRDDLRTRANRPPWGRGATPLVSSKSSSARPFRLLRAACGSPGFMRCSRAGPWSGPRPPVTGLASAGCRSLLSRPRPLSPAC